MQGIPVNDISGDATLRGPGQRIAKWAFPAALLVAFIVVVIGNINLSSLGVLADGADGSLLLGQPQVIRADEYVNGTPLALNQVRMGFPTKVQIGLTETNVSLLGSLPVMSPEQIFRPQSLGYFLLGESRGLAWQTWFSYFFALVALYLLFHDITRSVPPSVGLAVVAALSPYTAWWSGGPAFAIGCAALATWGAIRALADSSLRRRIPWILLAAYATTCLIFTLYPPWVVSYGYVCLALVLGFAVDSRAGIGRTASTALAILAMPVASAALWYNANKEAVRALGETIYPGQRVSSPGGGFLALLANAPSSPMAADGRPLELLNQSEVASPWFFAPIFVVVIGYLVSVGIAERRSRPSRPGPSWQLALGPWTSSLLGAATGLLALWSFTTVIPVGLGSALLLSSVPSFRVTGALGLAYVVALGLSYSRAASTARWARPRDLALIIAAVLSVFLSTLAVSKTLLDVDRSALIVTLTGAAVVLLGSVAIATASRFQLAYVALVGYVTLTFLMVNPLVHGLGAYRESTLAREMLALAENRPAANMVVLEGQAVAAIARSVGLEVLSGQTYYPDRTFWNEVLPGEEPLWNNYRTYAWQYWPEGDPIVGEVTGTDSATLKVDICSDELADLEIEFVLSPAQVAVPCAVRMKDIPYRGTILTLWEMDR